MKSRGGGQIVNIASLAAKKMSAGQCAAYTAAKSGLLGFTRHLAFEMGHYDIRVNAICPGFTMSPDKREAPGNAGGIVSSVASRIPLKEVNKPEDIAGTALFLVSDMSRMITGQAIDVDGGTSIANQDWESYAKRRKEAFARRQKSD
jgi:NAD(P)-dependent dehydrogenase (short-subunit alcohol dehydrogenase family)